VSTSVVNRMDVDLQEKIKLKLKEFLRRDYAGDVDRLNTNIGSAGGSPDFIKMPPLPFTGNPFALSSANCIALVGLNPKWGDREDKFAANRRDLKTCIDSFIAGDEEAFDRFLRLLASEFEEGGPYYGKYYTRLGNHLAREWFQGKVSNNQEGPATVREVFRRYVLKTDRLPWFSKTTNNIDAKKAGSSKDEALLAYYELLSFLFSAFKPKWIQFNGAQMPKVIEAITDTDLTRIEIADRTYIWVGRSRKLSGTPVLVHGFVNSQGGPQSPEQFKRVAQAFRNWVKDDSCFGFY
jgi:virulence-associated protein VapD